LETFYPEREYMNDSAWIGLIQRIPEAQQGNLVAVTITGSEMMVQKILVLEEQFMIFRGRLAGSTDAPRILLMPFDQLNHLAFNNPLPEAEIKTMFGNGTAAVLDAQPEPIPEQPIQAVDPAGETLPAPETTPPPADPPAADPPTAKPAPPSKSVLLARLRARLQRG
jgi:hypothetical protein